MALYVALEFWLTRGTTLFIDELGLFQGSTSFAPSALFAPFNGHLVLASKLLYAIALRLFGGSGAFEAAKFVEIGSVLALGGIFFAFVRRRVGRPVALIATVVLLFFGSAWEQAFSISGIEDVLVLASGVGALLLLEQDHGTRWGSRLDALACLALLVSVVSFSTGIAFAVGALCLLLLAGQPRRAWIAVVPLVTYVAWLVWVRLNYLPSHPGAQHIALSNMLLIPSEIAQQAAATAGALAGLNYNFGPTDVFGGVFSTSSAYGAVLALMAGGALVWAMRRRATPMLWGLIVVALAYWVELALGSGSGRNPTTIRYVYMTGTVWMLIAAEAWGRPVARRAAVFSVAGLAVVSLLGNVERLRDGMHFYRAFGTTMRAQLAALEIAQPSESPQFHTRVGQPQFALVTAGPYLAAVRRHGSPAYSASALARQSAALRGSADAMLVVALGIGPTAVPAGDASPHSCLTREASSSAPVVLALRPPGALLRASSGAALTIGQFSPGVADGALAAGQTARLRIPPDRSARSWRLTLSPGPARLAICRLPGA